MSMTAAGMTELGDNYCNAHEPVGWRANSISGSSMSGSGVPADVAHECQECEDAVAIVWCVSCKQAQCATCRALRHQAPKRASHAVLLIPTVVLSAARPSGPRGLEATETDEDIFLKLITPAILRDAVLYTNLYAHQTTRSQWTDTWDAEMRAFIGVILFLGAKNIDRPDAWQPFPFGDEYIKGIFCDGDLSICLRAFISSTTSPCRRKPRKLTRFGKWHPS